MAFDFAAAKTQARRAVHKTLAVPAVYVDDSMNGPMDIRARWHSRINRFGDLDRQGYAEIIENIDRIIFVPSDHAGFMPKRGGRVTFAQYGATFELDTREPKDGPLEVVWLVTRLKDNIAVPLALDDLALELDDLVLEIS